MWTLFHREMLERVLVKRLRDSDSDSEKEEEGTSSQLNKSSTDKPTDILTSKKPTETQVRITPHIQESILVLWAQSPGGSKTNYCRFNEVRQ